MQWGEVPACPRAAPTPASPARTSSTMSPFSACTWATAPRSRMMPKSSYICGERCTAVWGGVSAAAAPLPCGPLPAPHLAIGALPPVLVRHEDQEGVHAWRGVGRGRCLASTEGDVQGPHRPHPTSGCLPRVPDPRARSDKLAVRTASAQPHPPPLLLLWDRGPVAAQQPRKGAPLTSPSLAPHPLSFHRTSIRTIVTLLWFWLQDLRET